MLKPLPLAISSLPELLHGGYVYVDKTRHAYNLIMGGKRYFFVRPRRFGKTLFLSTLQEILEGNRELFSDLWIGKSDYQWPVHGVIRLDFSRLSRITVNDFKVSLVDHVCKVAAECGVIIPSRNAPLTVVLSDFIEDHFKKYGRVAILIDEYDKPLGRSIGDIEKFEAMIDVLDEFFSVVKSYYSKIQFVMLTGVQPFTLAGAYSGLNDLVRVSLDPDYADACGYTDDEIDKYFSEHIGVWSDARLLKPGALRLELKDWYNGYHFSKNAPAVYNPYSITSALALKEFNNFWIMSGSHAVLIDALQRQKYFFDNDNFSVSFAGLSVMERRVSMAAPLFFHAGFLTVNAYDEQSRTYQLDYPNREVRDAVQALLLKAYTDLDEGEGRALGAMIRNELTGCNVEGALSYLRTIFANVPCHIHDPQEKNYHALLLIVFFMGGLITSSEVITDKGRIDIVLQVGDYIYVIEVKLNVTPQAALEQIKERRYYERFMHQGKKIILWGINFVRASTVFDIQYVTEEL